MRERGPDLPSAARHMSVGRHPDRPVKFDRSDVLADNGAMFLAGLELGCGSSNVTGNSGLNRLIGPLSIAPSEDQHMPAHMTLEPL